MKKEEARISFSPVNRVHFVDDGPDAIEASVVIRAREHREYYRDE
jgi:hypothetical protein